MAIYQSMQRVRFRTMADYEQFKLVFAGVRHHLKTLPGFLHLTWWTHPDDPTWHNEISLWTSFEALKDWHMNTYHKHAKQWAVRTGAIMEDIIVNFELKSTRLIRVCPCCGHAEDKPYDLHQEQAPACTAVPAVRLYFPGDAGDTEQLRGVQGRQAICPRGHDNSDTAPDRRCLTHRQRSPLFCRNSSICSLVSVQSLSRLAITVFMKGSESQMARALSPS